MNDITKETFPKAKKLLGDFPEYLKDHDNYEKIERAILEAGSTPHSHAEIVDWAKCKRCQKAQWDRKEMMYKLGFKSAAHYMAWKKIHSTIQEKVILPKYNS